MKDDNTYPFVFIVGKLTGEIVDGDPVIEAIPFEITKENGMINASNSDFRIFISAEKWDILKNKLEVMIGDMNDDEG